VTALNCAIASFPPPPSLPAPQPGSDLWAPAHRPQARTFGYLDLPAITAAVTACSSAPLPLVTVNDGPNGSSGGVSAPLLVEAVSVKATGHGVAHAEVPGHVTPATRPLAAFAESHITPFMHLTYAVTWGSLAIGGVIVAAVRFRRSGRSGGGAGTGGVRGRRGVVGLLSVAGSVAGASAPWDADEGMR